ncbi:18220_t:CDS:1, partial [Racocetra fulgida]
MDPTDLQIMWILVGFPDEINFYSVHTRELYILEIEDQNIALDNKKSVLINVPKELPKNSILALSFEYPLFSDNLVIQDGKIELSIDYIMSNYDVHTEDSKSENDESEDDKSEHEESDDENPEYIVKYPLHSCVFISDDEFIEADVSTSE